jgi:small subunit ribosomal protein S1
MSSDANDPSNVSESEDAASNARRRILIGSQKDPEAYRPKRPRDWTPVAPPAEGANAEATDAEKAAAASAGEIAESKGAAVGQPQPVAGDAPPVVVEAVVPAAVITAVPAAIAAVAEPVVTSPPAPAVPAARTVVQPTAEPVAPPKAAAPTVPTIAAEVKRPSPAPTDERTGGGEAQSGGGDAVSKVLQSLEDTWEEETDDEFDSLDDEEADDYSELNRRSPLPAKLEDQLKQAMGETSLDDLIGGGETVTRQPVLELDTLYDGRVVAIQRDDVFIELGSREQGVVSLRQLLAPPEIGSKIRVKVLRFNREEGLYEVSVPNVSTKVADWSNVAEGITVEALVTGHNAGGLECEVNHLRGFIPVSQVALYRVEKLDEFVGQRFACVVTECNAERRNLVLSRRAVLEQEKEAARQDLMGSLEVGQIREGVVRKLMDFGAFVDLGGVDGLLHVSQLSWARVKHPSDVLQEGQSIRVKLNKIDPETGKISLGYRDMLENPWTQVGTKYSPQSIVKGVVTKIMEFGAFVALEPGVEGLVHISELAPKRVWRASDVVSEGQEVEVLVLSVDLANQRISLSIKALAPKPVVKKVDEPFFEEPTTPVVPPKRVVPLKGGRGSPSGGDRFGLKW